MNAAIQFGVLGPITVSVGDRPVVLGRRKERALLAVLLAASNQAVPLDRIIDLLWGDEPPERAMSSLHAYISNLRRQLEPERRPRSAATRLITRPPGYVLAVAPDEVDALRFETLANSASDFGRAGVLAEADTLFTEALGLWRGPVYGEFADEAFAIPEVLRLNELRATVVEERMGVRLAMGNPAAVAAEAEALLSVSPTRERTWGHLMLALYRSGRQADALRAFQRARDQLADASGLDPGPELRVLENRILTQDPTLLDVSAHVITGPMDGHLVPRSDPGNVPPAGIVGRSSELDVLTGIVGRSSELDVVIGRLSEVQSGRGQVVLVTGDAGIGKTAVADELCARASSSAVVVARANWPETLDRPELAPWLQILEQLDCGRSEAAAMVGDALTAGRSPTAALVGHVVTVIVGQARIRPTLLVFDDVQWAGELSHGIFRQLGEQSTTAPLMMVLVCRQPPADGSPSLSTTLAGLSRQRGVTRLDLQGLTREQLVEMIADATQMSPSPAMGEFIHDLTGGNSFYALELGRLLAAEGHLASEDPPETVKIPTAVRDVVRQRLGRLPDQAVAVLGIAAVLGNQVEPQLVQRVADADFDLVADQLDLAEAAGFLDRDPARIGRYRFGHELVRAAVLGAMPALHAAGLHRRAVEALVATYGEHDVRVVHRLARHATQAADLLGPEQVSIRIERSAVAARAMMDLHRANRSFREALDFAGEMSPGPVRDGRRANLMARVAQTRLLISGFDRSVDDQFAQALELSRSGTYDERIRVLLGYGTHGLLYGAVTEAIGAGAELLSEAGSDDAVAIIGGRYLSGFEALCRPDPAANRRLLEGDDRDDDYVAVAPTIRAGASALLDVVDGNVEAGADRAVALTRKLVIDGSVDGWVQAWALTFGLPALVLADRPDEMVAVTDPLPHRICGVGIIDHTIRGCRAWGLAATGEPAALDMLTEARHGLRARGEVIFRLILTLAQADVQCSMASSAVEELVAEAETAIVDHGLDGLRPWLNKAKAR